MKRLAAAMALALAAPLAAHAADSRYPDWPCQQVKVPKLSPAAFWTGPSIGKIGDAWQKDPQVEDLARRLAARKIPLQEAQKTAADFIKGAAADKKQKAALLFAGLFSVLDAERDQVMDGIERFSHRQQQLRDQLRDDLTKLRAAQDAPHPDAAEIDKLGTQVA
ncbi:MAG TPA: hypothetical protein VE224_18395, partial [Pseudolabrys sp.]|nr:hypothetical protein [Pseudolabrys sp.]